MATRHFVLNVIMISTLTIIRGKLREVDMCKRDIMIRHNILLYYDIRDLDLDLDDLTCQCDLYTPTFKGCVRLQAQSVDTLTLLENCELPKNQEIDLNSSCPVQFRVNYIYDNCTHNITVAIVPEKVLKTTVKRLFNVSASDGSGVYVNCKSTASLTTVTMVTDTTDYKSTEPTEREATETTILPDLNSTQANITTPSTRLTRRIKLSEVADQIDILIATGSGFVGGILVITLICTCKRTKRKGRLEVTAVQAKETDVQALVTVPSAGEQSSTYDSVFVDTCSAEIKREGSGSYTEPFNNEADPTYAPVIRRNSNGGYDNVAFEN